MSLFTARAPRPLPNVATVSDLNPHLSDFVKSPCGITIIIIIIIKKDPKQICKFTLKQMNRRIVGLEREGRFTTSESHTHQMEQIKHLINTVTDG